MALEIPKSWTFKNDWVARNFDTHVREQLPWYDCLTELVAVLAKHFLPEGARGYDVGASTGNVGASLEDVIKARNVEWTGIDNSEKMLGFYRAPGKLEIFDAIDFPFKSFDLMVCFLSIMFMPVEKRKRWLEKMFFERLKVGGAIIVVDREQPEEGAVSTALARSVWLLKKKAGATSEDIFRKEMSLCGVQRPIPKDFFDGLPAREFFRFGDFAAWIIEKRE